MISVTSEYLVNLIERQVNRTIALRRKHASEPQAAESNPDVSNEELADFILSIPYFDERIKHFILGISNERTIIISQSWEIAFMIRARKWSETDDWLNGAFRLSMTPGRDDLKANADFLTLPY